MNYKFNFLIVLILIILIPPVKAQSSEINLTGNLYTDSKILFEDGNLESLPQIKFQSENKKSPFLAGLFSLVVPGAGEIYSENYWRAAIFLAIEAAVITTAVIYDNKGNDQTEKFQNYADDYKNPDHHWSVVKYAEWIIEHKLSGNDPGIITSDDQSLPPWERVNWSLLNENETGSHKLYLHGEQQYYEMIGKYHQFSPGWNDFPTDQISNEPISPNFLYYAGERGKANDYYNVASKAVIGIYINHFLSALDAVWTTIDYNNSLAVKMRMEEVYFADRMELVPTVKVSFNF
ncbi:MAG: hypothetical protein Q7S39_02725 [Ignavibacteria bacterium]|nr:hypothetical protein [Ignavibacteria bacterium]